QSLLAATALSLLAITPVIALAPRLVAAFGVDPAVVAASTPFVRLVMLSIPQSAIMFVVGSALRASGDTPTPLLIRGTVNIINISGNYVFIFGKLGFPALGVPGAALGTTLAFTVGVLFALILLIRGRLVLRLRGPLRPEFATIRRILAIGSPTALEQIM